MGTGFGTRGMCTQGVCLKKILRPPSAAKFLFHRGVKFFFLRGGFVSRQGCDFAKNSPTGVSKRFFPAGSLTLGCTPPCLWQGGVLGNFRFLGGCAHPHTPTPCPSMLPITKRVLVNSQVHFFSMLLFRGI